ncbi:MAG: ATP-dependent helicase [Dehalococcoidia bacterium]|nr:ATP-dependent helicase [Dehalococcoidia bacterium]
MTATTKVVGPPGTGKTTWMLKRIAAELSRGVLPQEVLYASFSRAASYEGRDRAMVAFPQFVDSDFENFATIHAICYRLLGLDREAIFTGKKLEEFGKTVRYEYSLDTHRRDNTEQDIIDTTLVTLGDYSEAFIAWWAHTMEPDFKKAYASFVSRQVTTPDNFNGNSLTWYMEQRTKYKNDKGLWDFQDMLAAVLQRRLVPPGMKACFFDEQQDSSRLLFEVAKLWASASERAYFAADPYQAIYSFMGADANLFIDLKADQEVALKQSHRCSQAVYELSRKVVQRMRSRYPNDEFVPTVEPGVTKRSPLVSFDLENYPGTTFALFRTRYQVSLFYKHLMDKGIPFITRRGKESPLTKIAGESVATMIRLAAGESVYIGEVERMMEYVPQRGFMERGAKTAITNKAAESPSLKIDDRALPLLGFQPSFMDALRQNQYLEIIKLPAVERAYLQKVVSKFGSKALLDPPKLQLGTIHSVKGLEADRVLLGLDLTRSPYENLEKRPDEEHRVFYVAVTRAKNEVDLISPDNYEAYPL